MRDPSAWTDGKVAQALIGDSEEDGVRLVLTITPRLSSLARVAPAITVDAPAPTPHRSGRFPLAGRCSTDRLARSHSAPMRESCQRGSSESQYLPLPK
jgi:hypothetical protein